MNVLQYSAASGFYVTHPHRPFHTSLRQCTFTVRSSISLPIPEVKAKYYDQLQAAVDVVERACRLCVDVQRSLFSTDKKILEKIDQTPVTIADFGVQALVSLEMSKLFPSIPLVAEEDSAFLRQNNLVNEVVDVVTDKSTFNEKKISQDDVIKAIDRGGKAAYFFGPELATYWILDPIDGTRGFVQGSEALYVVGLALVVEGEIVLGVMGCPNWQDDQSGIITTEVRGDKNTMSRSGIIMISHVGCGTWRKRLWDSQIHDTNMAYNWTRCFVDNFHQVHEARFCISDSQAWESLPLSAQFNATTHDDYAGENQILLLPTCCGRFTFKSKKIVVHSLIICICLECYPIVFGNNNTVRLVPLYSEHYFPSLMQWKLPVICLGSMDYLLKKGVIEAKEVLCKYLMVASGRASVFILRTSTRRIIKVWDHAVGVICIHEAGGKVTDWKGSSLDFAADQVERRVIFPSGGVLVTNNVLHKPLLKIISSS